MKLYNYTIMLDMDMYRKTEIDMYDNVSIFEMRDPERAMKFTEERFVISDIEYYGNIDDIIPDNERIVKKIPLYMLIKHGNTLNPMDIIITIDKSAEIDEYLNTYLKLTESQLLNPILFKEYPFKYIKRKY